MAKKWEYKMVELSGSKTSEFEDALNMLGDKDWELVSVNKFSIGGNIWAYLKREKAQKKK